MVLSTPMKRPDVMVWVIGSSLRQVIVVPTCTVVVAGWNISELRLMTGPEGAGVVAIGVVADGLGVRAATGEGPAAARGSEASADEKSAEYGLISCNIHASYSE